MSHKDLHRKHKSVSQSAHRSISHTDYKEKEPSHDYDTQPEKNPYEISWRRIWKHWRGISIGVCFGILSNLISNQIADVIPVLIQQYKGFLIGGSVVVLSSMFISCLLPEELNLSIVQNHNHARTASFQYSNYWLFSRGLPIGSFLLFLLLSISLVVVVAIRPPWCPIAICPAPSPVLNPNGVNDGNLEIYPNVESVESPAYAIPGQLEQYSLKHLPTRIGAVRVDQQGMSNPYRVVIGIHNLHRDGSDIIIEQVALVNIHIGSVPDRLNVWTNGIHIDYDVHPFRAIYTDSFQDGKGLILAESLSPLRTYVHLDPGEADQLDVQVLSHSRLPTDLKFQVQVTYRMQDSIHTLTLWSDTFEVIFSNASNWHPCQFNQQQRFTCS